MPTITKTITVSASPDEAWSVLGNLEALDWIPGLTSAQVTDGKRVCTMADGSLVREDITEYAPELRTYSYHHTETPLPVSDSRGTFTVEPDGAGAKVTWEARFEPLDPSGAAELTRMLDGINDQVMASLAQKLVR